MKKALLFLICIFYSLSALTDTTEGCILNDVVVVECVLEKSRKTLSVCASKDGKSAHYKFSHQGKTELRVDFSTTSPLFRWVNSDSHVTFFGFIKNNYTYLIGVPQETLDAKSFLMVQKSHLPQNLSLIKFCTTNSFGEKHWPSTAIKDVNEKVLSDNYIFMPN